MVVKVRRAAAEFDSLLSVLSYLWTPAFKGELLLVRNSPPVRSAEGVTISTEGKTLFCTHVNGQVTYLSVL